MRGVRLYMFLIEFLSLSTSVLENIMILIYV